MRLKVPPSQGPRGRPLMLKKYVSKFTIDILPSVLATIIGAYIVNHYIVAKPADAPVAAAVSAPDPAKSVAAIPEAGVKAKGISERAMLEKTATEKSFPIIRGAGVKGRVISERARREKTATKKPAVVDKPADPASLPAEPRRHQPVLREKAVAKAVQPPAPAAPPVEAAAVPED